jgi:thiamine biosynthesis protein ThiI
LTHAPSVIAAHYAEIALKGRNRPRFLRRLVRNIQAALAGEPVTGIDHVESRLLVHLADPERTEAAAAKLSRVFGIQWLSPAVSVPRTEPDADLTALCEVAVELARADSGEARHFKIDTRRSDRAFPLPSPQINHIVGAAVQEAVGLPARMRQPDFTVHVLVMRERALVFTRRIPGPGGLPAGTGGRVTALLSGGIDSPVAVWLLMKRGCRPDLVHFHSGRSAAEADPGKIVELATILAGYAPAPLYLHLVPVFAYELRAIGRIESRYDMLMFRRFMVKTSTAIARRADSLALVTGDSLGQVASQTLPNLAAISSDVQLPIFRPLIGLDKYQITEMAKQIGTYEVSIKPYRDCCSIRSPRPVLNARAEDLLQLSQAMDLEGAVREAVDAAERRVIDPPDGDA